MLCWLGVARGVEGGLAFIEAAAGRGAEGDDMDAIHADVADVSRGVHAAEQVLEAGGGEGVRVVAGAMHG